jgi:hypothetical protein
VGVAIEPRPELGELALDALGDIGGRDAARDHAEDECEHREAARPRDQAVALAAQCLSGGRGQQGQARLRGVAHREEPAADVPASAEPRGDPEQDGARHHRKQQHRRPGAGERAQFLGPSQRRRPAQPAGPAGDVGHRPQQHEQPDRAAAQF